MDVKNVWFTPEKREIIWLMWNEPDFEASDIARCLGKSTRTIEGHLREIYIALQPWRGTTARAMITVLAKAGWFDQAPVEETNHESLRVE